MPPGVTLLIFPYAVCVRDAELGGPMPAEALVSRWRALTTRPKKYCAIRPLEAAWPCNPPRTPGKA